MHEYFTELPETSPQAGNKVLMGVDGPHASAKSAI